MCEIREQICSALDAMGIAYRRYHHAPAETLEDNRQNDARFGFHGAYYKNLLLCDKHQTGFYLLLLPFEKRFRTSEISRQIGSTRLAFATDERLSALLHCVPGSASALGLLFDSGGQVTLLADEALRETERVCFHPNDNTETLVLRTHDFLDTFLPATGHTPRFVQAE